MVAMDELDSPTCTTEAIIGKLKERAIHVYPERDTEKITWGKRKRQVRRHGNQYKQIPHMSNRSLRGGGVNGIDENGAGRCPWPWVPRSMEATDASFRKRIKPRAQIVNLVCCAPQTYTEPDTKGRYVAKKKNDCGPRISK